MKILKYIWRVIRQKILKHIGEVTGKPFTQIPDHFLIIAPHPDDEIFGCSGIIARCPRGNLKSKVLFLSEGEASHKGCCNSSGDRVGEQRRALAGRTAKIIGISATQLHFLSLKDGAFPRKGQEAFKRTATLIANAIGNELPEAVFCPHPFESWPDHIAATDLTIAAINMLPLESRPKLYYYCVWFWYSMPLSRVFQVKWRNARLLDITLYLGVKKQAMRTYLDALAPCGNPWVGKLPRELLRAFEWNKELYFEAD